MNQFKNQLADIGDMPTAPEDHPADPPSEKNNKQYRELFFYRNLVRENPNNTRYRYEIAEIFIKLRDYENAIAHLKIALGIDSSFSKAHTLMGDCFMWMGYKDRALREYEHAATIGGDDVAPLKKAFDLAFEHGDYDRGIALAENALKIDPTNRGFRRDLSLCYSMIGEIQQSHDAILENIQTGEADELDYAQYGSTLNRLNKYAQAAEALEKAREFNPDNHVYAVNLANAYASLNRIDDAETQYLNAIRANPESTAAWFNLGELQLRHKRPDNAVSSFERVVSLDKNDAEAWMYIAEAKQKKSPQQAIQALNKAKKLGLKKNSMRYIQADILESLGKLKEATATRTVLYQDFSYDKNNLYKLVKLYIKTGRPNDAMPLVSLISEKITDGDIVLFMNFSSYLRFFGFSKEELDCLQAISKIDSAYLPVKERIFDLAFESGYFGKAYKLAGKMNLRGTLSLKKTYVILGHLLFVGDYEHAADEINRLLDVVKYIPAYWSKIMNLFKRHGQSDALFNTIDPYIYEGSPDIFFIIGLCKALEESGFYAEFEKICRFRLDNDPSNRHMLNLFGQFLIRRKRANEVMGLLKEHNTRHDDIDIAVTLGEAFMQTGENDHAMAYFQEALKKNNAHHRALYNLGLLENRAGGFERAQQYFDKAIETQAGDFKLWFNRGLLKIKAGEDDAGTEDILTASKLEPRNSTILSAVGTRHLKKKKYRHAKYYFLKSIACDKGNSNAWNNLSILFEKNGDTKKSNYCAEKLRSLRP